MRNIFDQYAQPENRLTHAVLSALAHDPGLLRKFVAWAVGEAAPAKRLHVLEQSLPGEFAEVSEEEAERRGLPDGCITDLASWALLIESKVATRLSNDQLRRHMSTARRRGLDDIRLLVVTIDGPDEELPEGCIGRHWAELYSWFHAQRAQSAWAKECAEYFEAAEARWADGYLEEGTLTVFAGIPFAEDEPYTYVQGKRLLGLLRNELLGDGKLLQQLGVDPEGPGRGAITGRAADGVWDYISLTGARDTKVFTKHPHLTIGIGRTQVEGYVTIPNGVSAPLRAELLGSDFGEFEDRILVVTRGLAKVASRFRGSMPALVVVQRHYPSQRSTPVIDAVLRFDPRTADSASSRAAIRVKYQPEWLRTAFDTLARRRSNLQFQIGMDFPYAACDVVRTKEIADAIAQVWLACKPVLPRHSGR